MILPKGEIAMKIEINDDFDLTAIHKSGQCFRWEPIGPEAYRIPFRGSCLRIRSIGENTWAADCTIEEYETVWRGYFDLAEDYAAIRGRIDPAENPFLARAAERGRGIRILRQDLWETLVSFIISQNRNIPAIRRSIELLCRRAGERRLDRAGEEYYTFPSPEAVAALSEEALRACALGYRCRYVRAAAEFAHSGALRELQRESLTDEEALSGLMRVCGVGVKVASCVTLFGLHRLDSFPVDTWIRRVLQNEYPNGYPRERYRPYNGVYQQYMFALYRGEHGARDLY